jgi:hypothetical protein
MAKTKVLICPYCGQTQPAGERCRGCGGLFEPLSRQATHNAMGPWFVRDARRPFQPGCSYETLVQLLERGQVNKYSIIRGPTTRQFWTVARRVPGVAHLLGYCHDCDASVDPGDHGCHACGVPFGAYLDRNFLGLPEIQPLPWEPGMEQARDASGLRQPSLQWSPRGGPGAGAGRISSFAHDEDLAVGTSDPAVGGDDARSVLAREDPSTVAATAEPGTHPGESWGEPTLEEVPTGYATRAMQRRLATQRRSIRILAALLVVTSVVSLSVLTVLVVQSGRSVGIGASDPEPSPAPSSAQAEPPPAQPEAAAPATMELEELLDAPSEAPPPVVEDDPDDEAYQRALELLENARQADRAVADRIVDYEQALEILESLSAGSPKRQPADLAELIEQAHRELERLKLQEFFP